MSIKQSLAANARIVRERPTDAFINACTAAVLLPLVGLCSTCEAALLWSMRHRWTLEERILHVGHLTREWLAPLVFKLLGTQVEYRGLEHFADGRCHVVIATHGSLIDPAVMGKVPRFRIIGKKSMLRNPIGWMGRWGGQIFVDYKQRGASMGVIRAAVDEAPGYNFVFFGEGTRSPDGTVGPLKLGAMEIARSYGYSVIPTRIDEAFEALPKGPFLGFRRGRTIVATFGAPMPHCQTKEELPEYAERVRDAILAL